MDDQLTSLSLKQHVTFPTHMRGHTLGWIIRRELDELISSITPGDTISDHT